MINQVPNQVMPNPNINATYHSIVNTSSNHGAGGHPIHHEWLWFRLEGHSGWNLGPAQTEYQSITTHCTSETKSNAPADPAAKLS